VACRTSYLSLTSRRPTKPAATQDGRLDSSTPYRTSVLPLWRPPVLTISNVCKTVLSNGLAVLSERMENVRSVSIGIWLKTDQAVCGTLLKSSDFKCLL
jgi:hypothetical protein